MAIFQDNFVETSDTTLASHTPNEGTSWTLLWQDGANPVFSVIGASDTCKGTTQNNSGVMYTADGTYPSANYDVVFTLIGSVAVATRPFYVFVRMQDQENMYGVRLTNVASGGQLYKKVSGTWTALGSAFTCPATGSVCKLEINGTALKFYDDGVEVASATDSDIASAGKAGLGLGGGAELTASTDDANSVWEIDTLTVTDLGGGTTEFLNASGSVTPTGALILQPQTIYAGAIAGQGSIIRDVLTAYAGQITGSGEPDFGVQTTFAGSITPSGALEVIKIVLLSIEGAITSSGALVIQAGKALTGSITATGGIIKDVLTAYTGQVTASGEPALEVQTRLAGSVTPSGSLVTQAGKFLAGSITSIGNLIRDVSIALAGPVTSVGNLIKQPQVFFYHPLPQAGR